MKALLAVFVLALAGCASSDHGEWRYAPTGIAEGEEIGVLLGTYWHVESDAHNPAGADPPAAEQLLDDCLRREMLAANGGLRLVPARALREAAFPGEPIGALQLPAEGVLAQLADGRLSRYAALRQLRYVALLDFNHSEYDTKPAFAADRIGFAVGAESKRSLALTATILDIAQRRVAGLITVDASGTRGAGVMVILVLPIPVYFNSQPEAGELCRTLGRALARFIVQ